MNDFKEHLISQETPARWPQFNAFLAEYDLLSFFGGVVLGIAGGVLSFHCFKWLGWNTALSIPLSVSCILFFLVALMNGVATHARSVPISPEERHNILEKLKLLHQAYPEQNDLWRQYSEKLNAHCSKNWWEKFENIADRAIKEKNVDNDITEFQLSLEPQEELRITEERRLKGARV